MVASVQRLRCVRWALWMLSIHTGLILGILRDDLGLVVCDSK
jgi:hypothetical protein